jgi:hypothetical protein
MQELLGSIQPFCSSSQLPFHLCSQPMPLATQPLPLDALLTTQLSPFVSTKVALTHESYSIPCLQMLGVL